MKKSNRQSVIGLLVILSLPLSLPGLPGVQAASAAPQEKPVSTPKFPAASDAGVAQAAEHLRLVTAGYHNGINSKDDVSDARIALAESRLRAAQDRNEFTGVRDNLETIVTERLAQLDRVNAKVRAGAAAPGETTTAEEALAEARVRLDLYAVVLARQKWLWETRVRHRAGISSAEEMATVTASLQRAELKFVQSGTD